jgi:hypothetical protein
MNAEPTVSSSAVGLVRRSRAGDQNATAMLVRIGEEARKGGQRALAAYQAAKAFIESNPSQPFELGTEPALVADGPLPSDGAPLVKVDPEKKKPPLPRGIFNTLFKPDWTAVTIVRACGYRNGMPAAAAVLAGGAPLTNPAVRQFGAENFGSDESTAVFYHGVRNPTIEAWNEVAPHLDVPLRRCLAIGQCIGQARKLQAVRQRGSQISQFDPAIGWEMGE